MKASFLKFFKVRRTPVRRYTAILLALLAFTPRLFAAVDDDNPWSKVSARLVISHVTLQVTNQQIHVTGSNLNVTLAWPMPMVSDYVCAVRNPFSQPEMEDGVVQDDANFRVLKDDMDFKASAFPRFAFFTNRPTTIGLLIGHAAANGGSVQQLLLVDVETGAHVLIPLDEGKMPHWLEPKNHPPAFATWRRSNDTAGADLRVGQAFRFKEGQYRRDLVTEQRLLVAQFQQSQLTAAQRQALRTAEADILDTAFSIEGRPLDNFIYYGTRSGNGKAVDELLATLPPELQSRAKERRTEINKESKKDVLAEARNEKAR